MSSGTISVQVDVWTDDVLGALADEDIAIAARARGMIVLEKRDAVDLTNYVRAGLVDAAALLIDRHLRPKFATMAKCLELFAKRDGASA